jgi:hypothetical protein
MKANLIVRMVLIAAAVAVVGGCNFSEPGNLSSQRVGAGNPFAPNAGTMAAPDSLPGHPPKPERFTVQFAGADTVSAGQTSTTRWVFGNSGHSSLTANWTLTDQNGFPGFPKQGTVTIGPLSTQLLAVPVAVPDSAVSGGYVFHMSATTQNNKTATANGVIQVVGGSQPPDTTFARQRR